MQSGTDNALRRLESAEDQDVDMYAALSETAPDDKDRVAIASVRHDEVVHSGGFQKKRDGLWAISHRAAGYAGYDLASRELASDRKRMDRAGDLRRKRRLRGGVRDRFRRGWRDCRRPGSPGGGTGRHAGIGAFDGVRRVPRNEIRARGPGRRTAPGAQGTRAASGGGARKSWRSSTNSRACRKRRPRHWPRHLMVQPEAALKTLGSEELGLSESTYPNPWTSALSATLSTAAGAFIPIVPFFFSSGYPGDLHVIRDQHGGAFHHRRLKNARDRAKPLAQRCGDDRRRARRGTDHVRAGAVIRAADLVAGMLRLRSGRHV